MMVVRFFLLMVLFSFTGLDGKDTNDQEEKRLPHPNIKGALLLKTFKSLADFEKIVKIEYQKGLWPSVTLTHEIPGRKVVAELKSGVSETDFKEAKFGGFWKRVGLVFKSPYGISKRQELRRIYALTRRRPEFFGEGDPAFYDLAETMMANISDEDKTTLPPEYFTEKGYLNTFNHITSQAFTTSIFSEELADFLADIHERKNMAELVSGKFTAEQIADIDNGPTDNFMDIINNEWGQELGKNLKKKYQIDEDTIWTAELLADYLNSIQSYFTWALDIDFKPFRPTDDLIIKFYKKINIVMDEVPILVN